MATDRSQIVDDIFQRPLHKQQHPEKTLEHIVRLVSDRLKTDVCSVYVYDPSANRLILKETLGLSTESMGNIEMNVSEGLTGLVIERMAPVFVVDPKTHPRFKYYPDSGEEKYQTFLGPAVDISSKGSWRAWWCRPYPPTASPKPIFPYL